MNNEATNTEPNTDVAAPVEPVVRLAFPPDKVFTTISAAYQIDDLEGFDLKDGLEFFYSLFFKSPNADKDYLLMNGSLVLFIQDGLINDGNRDNIPSSWDELSYDAFRSLIAA